MKPAPRLLLAVGLWALSAISLLFFSGSIASLLWWAAGAILAAFALLDLLHGWRRPAPSAERIVPNALSVQQPHAIKVRIPSAELPARATLADHHPGDDPLTGLPSLLTRAENELTEFTYHYRPSRRGPVAFGDLEFWFPSQLGFWSLRKTCPARCTVPVYPDFPASARRSWTPTTPSCLPAAGSSPAVAKAWSSTSSASITPATACVRSTGKPLPAAAV